MPALRTATKAATRELAESYFQAIAERDAQAMADHWHEEGVDELVPVGIFRGPGQIRDYFGELFTAFPDLDITVERITVDKGVASVQWRATGTFQGGSYMGIEPTGRRVDIRGCDCLEIAGGKIVRNTAYYDGAALARGLGLLPARGTGGERAMVAALNAVTKVRTRLASSGGRFQPNG